MNEQKIVKLAEQTESLFVLLLRAYAQYLFLRPMMVDVELIARHGAAGKRSGFEGLRLVLYWAFILELVKICDDSDPRTPSISRLMKELENPQLLALLEDRRSRHTLPPIEGETVGYRRLRQAEEDEFWRHRFRETHSRLVARAGALLSSPALAGFKTVRDKLVAHNELRQNPDGRYALYDIGNLNLKFGDERALLEQAREVVDGLNSVVRGVSFSWESFFEPEERDIRQFWELKGEPLP